MYVSSYVHVKLFNVLDCLGTDYRCREIFYALCK